jgi:pyridoxal 5'-phosphate synthase pdxT subunit
VHIGVLALQGAFIEHIRILQDLGAETCEVRLPAHLDGLDALIIPGGESTTIGKLATMYELMEPLRAFGMQRPVWGTCAGAIFLSKDAHRQQPLLSLKDITVERNAYGRQVDSFEIDLTIETLEEPQRPFRAVFIRAPLIENVGAGVEILVELPKDDSGRRGRIAAARQGKLLATAFHPELTADDRFHRYFLDQI